MKLLLAPSLVAAATLAGRRWGSRVSGWLVGFPIVAGPILLFFLLEQGAAFTARAAQGALLGLLALCSFIQVYAWSARIWPWQACLPLGWGAFSLVTLGLRPVEAAWPWALAAAWLAFTLAWAGLPRLGRHATVAPPRGDLAMRAAATAALVLALTGGARALGPAWSGLLTPFPVASTVLAVFAHRQHGAAGAVAVYRGFLPGLYGFAAFCAVLAATLESLGAMAAFSLALAAVAAIQGLVLFWVRRPHR